MERWGYALTAPALVIAPNASPDGTINGAVLAAGAAATALAAKRLHDGDTGTGRTLLRLSPLITALAVDVTALHTNGWLLDTLLATGWAAALAALAPLSRTAKRRALTAPNTTAPALTTDTTAPPAAATTGVGDDFTRGVQHLWERAGNPGRTVIVHVDRHPGTAHDFTMLLRAAEDGRPITNLNEVDIAAAFGVRPDPNVVKILDVATTKGRQCGPGWREVRITPDAATAPRETQSDAQWWETKIGHAHGPIPGTKLVDKGRDPRGFTYWIARTTDGTEPAWRTDDVCTAMGAKPTDGRIHLFEDGDRVMIQVWDESPLARIYDATRDLLTPDTGGWFTIGYKENGQPARRRVHTDRGAAHGMWVAPSGGGKSEGLVADAAAYALWGAVVWAAAEAPDEKIGALAPHVDRQGFGALYIVRMLRAIEALMDIRGDMTWADGKRHDWRPGAKGCPYSPLQAIVDEFLSAAGHHLYGAEITDLAARATVKGRKYGIGVTFGTQSAEVQDGFTRLMAENIRENSIPIMLRTPPGRMVDEFKALGFTRDQIPDPLPRALSSTKPTGRLDRIMKGEPEPPAASNLGGVGWIIEGKEAPRLRTLRVFRPGHTIDDLFPDLVTHLTDHEIRELQARDLWGDWNAPDDTDPDDGEETSPRGGSKQTGRKGRGARTAGSSALDEAERMLNTVLTD
nr:chromosome segregation protein ParM [Streptomyces taklimakanensis]